MTTLYWLRYLFLALLVAAAVVLLYVHLRRIRVEEGRGERLGDGEW